MPDRREAVPGRGPAPPVSGTDTYRLLRYCIGPKTGIGFGKHDAADSKVRASFVRPNGRMAL
jgi:hypothetical protein